MINGLATCKNTSRQENISRQRVNLTNDGRRDTKNTQIFSKANNSFKLNNHLCFYASGFDICDGIYYILPNFTETDVIPFLFN